MLYIDYGEPEDFKQRYNKFIEMPPLFFNHTFNPKWLESDLAKEIIEDVDKSIVESPYCIKSSVLGQISPFMISGGAKALILMLQDDLDVTVWGTAMGDNCFKWILKISKIKDVYLCLSHVMCLDTDEEIDAIMVNNNAEIHSQKDYIDAIIDLA